MTALERLQTRIPEETNEYILEEMIESAKDIILSLRFPFDSQREEVEPQYIGLQVQIAEDLYNRLGASGQLQHSENSISRIWGSEWVSRDLLMQIVPKCGKV